MRVLVVTPSYPRFRGDYHGRFIQDLCCRLAENGLDINVLTPRTRTYKAYKSAFDVTRFPFLPSKRMEFLPERTMTHAPLRHLIQLPPYLTSAYLHLIAEQTDIVHAHLAIPLGYVATLSPRHTPLVVTCHGSDCTLPYENSLYRPFMLRTLRKASKVVAVSRFIRDLAVRLGALQEKVKVVYLGVDTTMFRPATDKAFVRRKYGIPANHIVVGALGRLVPEKRVEDIIRAATIVSGKIDAYFVVGGDGPDRPRLENLAKRLGVRNVSFIGEVADAVSFHQICDIFVLASVREGLSISLQEAMATGCVPVAVDGLGCPELVREGVNGFLFGPRDAEGMAEKILRAASNPGLGRKARETIEEGFDMRKNAMRYVEIYYEVLSGR